LTLALIVPVADASAAEPSSPDSVAVAEAANDANNPLAQLIGVNAFKLGLVRCTSLRPRASRRRDRANISSAPRWSWLANPSECWAGP
jgi:hypothetical protein